MAKISVSIDDELLAEIREYAAPGEVSRWLGDAAARRLRDQRLAEATAQIAEETGGPFTGAEIEDALRWVGRSSTPARGSRSRRVAATSSRRRRGFGARSAGSSRRV